MSGVDDENIQSAEGLDDALDHGRVPGLVADVARQRQRPDPGFLDQGDPLPGVRLLGRKIADRHVCALAGEGDGDRPPYAGIAARDQGLAPL